MPAPIDEGDESVLLLGGACGAGTPGFRARSDDAHDESAIEAGGACGAGTTGFRRRSETATRHCREPSEWHRATGGRARAAGAIVVASADARAAGERVGASAPTGIVSRANATSKRTCRP
jgi:hypothetical protein